MAKMKLNFVLWDLGVGPSFNATSDTFQPPSAASIALTRRTLAYFRQRHISVALQIGGKWDPRTLEGKAVVHEPFAFSPSNAAVAIRPVT